jgi:regulator of protease activity HflC (stomatin/prohibitin superfamily)
MATVTDRRLPPVVLGAGIAVAAVAVLLLNPFYTVDAGQQAVVTRLGAVAGVSGPGLHMKAPLIDVVHKISTRTNAIDWGFGGTEADRRMEAYSSDQQPAHISVKITYSVKKDPASVRQIYTQYGTEQGFADAVVVPRAYENVKTVFGQFTAVTAIQHRAQFNAQVEQAVRAAIAGPVQVESVQIQDIAFSEAYENQVEERMKAQIVVERTQQEKLTKQLQADMLVIQAKAEADSTRLKGEAEASAIRARAGALTANPNLVQLTAAEKWNGVLPTTMVPGAGVPLVTLK